jgi:hypothetical protein
MKRAWKWIGLALAASAAPGCGGQPSQQGLHQSCACGPTGPHTHAGIGACDQLRERLCDPDRTFDPTSCNASIDTIEQNASGPDRTCTSQLQVSCGRPLQVDPPTL